MKTQKNPELANLVALNASYEAFGVQVQQTLGRIADLETNRTTLQERLVKAKGAKPTENEDLDDPLVAALAADPGADLASEDVAVAAERSASLQSAMRTWKKEVSLLERAIAKIEGQHQQARQELAELKEQQKDAHVAFAAAAHAYLLGVFRDRFEDLYHHVLAPLAGIEQMKNGHGREVIPTFSQFCRRLEITHSFYVDSRQCEERYFPKVNPHARGGAQVDNSADVERFRLTVAALKS
ncbi:MAG TPA: hypothetical protein VH331_14405 [Allosphingosinicella sp.]|nr:hypothetical protein [Allosphingosinicella sp.]